jgi:hypothetical protein
MGTTDGLVSAYQVLDFSDQRIASHNLSVTNAEVILVELVSTSYLEELREKQSEEKPTRTFLSAERKGNLQFAAELSAWDAASDEALAVFEAKLD